MTNASKQTSHLQTEIGPTIIINIIRNKLHLFALN